MFQSTYLGRYFQIDTYLHWTFKLLLIWVLISSLLSGGFGYAVSATTLLLFVFFCVYLHELGHALMARRYGIATLDITMLPIGGLARLERMPRDPLPELWIALAGPAVNVVIALGLGIGLWINDAFDFRSTVPSDVVRESIFLQLVAINASLAIFNLLPALPMDGGRVLRSLLQLRMDRMRATQIAARVSRYLAFFMIIAGLFYGWTLTFIGVFVLIGSFQELLGARIEAINEASQSGRWIDPRAGSTSPSPYGTIFEDGPSSSGTPFFKTYTWTFGSPPSPPSPRARQQDDDDDILDATDVRRIE